MSEATDESQRIKAAIKEIMKSDESDHIKANRLFDLGVDPQAIIEKFGKEAFAIGVMLPKALELISQFGYQVLNETIERTAELLNIPTEIYKNDHVFAFVIANMIVTKGSEGLKTSRTPQNLEDNYEYNPHLD